MKRTFLVSQPGIVRNATESVLRMFPGLDLIGCAAGSLSATRLLEELEVDLLLIDANVTEDEVLALLRWVKEHRVQIRCVAMTMTTQQQEKALSEGADWAFKRANLSGELDAVLKGTAGIAPEETAY